MKTVGCGVREFLSAMIVVALPAGIAVAEEAADPVRASVARGVAFLKGRQEADGGFRIEPPQGRFASVRMFRVGFTGLAGLAILSEEGYTEPVARAAAYLLEAQDDRGFFRIEALRSYKTGIETGYVLQFLIELQAQDRAGRIDLPAETDGQIASAVERALAGLASFQTAGGTWPYIPAGRHRLASHEEIATVIAVLPAVLRAGAMGYEVPEGMVDRAIGYVRGLRAEGGFRNEAGRPVSPHVTIAVLPLLERLKDREGVAELLDHARTGAAATLAGDYLSQSWWDSHNADPRQDYGFHYVVLARRRGGIEPPDGADARITETLLGRQGADGGWDSRYSRVGATAFAVLALNLMDEERLEIIR